MTLDQTWLRKTKEKAEAEAAHLKELTEKRSRIDAEIQRISERVRSWQVILSDHKASTPAAVPTLTAEGPDAEETDGSGHTGLRQAIRQVLFENPTGIRPREVTRLLRAKGFKTQAKTDLSIRVTAELWRMKKNGAVRKCKSGYLPPKEEPARSEEVRTPE